MDKDTFYESLGFISGILFPLSLTPQIYKSYKTKDLSDISYYWQLLYVFSLTLVILYSTHFDLKPIYLSSIFELILMIILIFMKFIYTNNKIDTNIEVP